MFHAMEVQKLMEWIAAECVRQGVGPERIPWMLDAYFLLYGADELTADLVEELGMAVEPEKNTGWRKMPVVIGKTKAPDWREIPRLMEQLCDWTTVAALAPNEWYREFEEIHPFTDGNGRVGALIWNWLKGHVPMDMESPPDYWTEASTA